MTRSNVGDFCQAYGKAFRALHDRHLPAGVGSKCFQMLCDAIPEDMIREVEKRMHKYDLMVARRRRAEQARRED